MPTALITGITGQDGAYLAELLLTSGYAVVGTHRPGRSPDTWRLTDLGVADRVLLQPLDLDDADAVSQLVADAGPDEVYNLAAQSSVGLSFKEPSQTARTDALGVVHLLEAIRFQAPTARLFQASSCEMFGNVESAPQNEETAFAPRNPYGAAKLFAHQLVSIYREAYGIFAVSGILFNHESRLRSPGFVTRKITRGIARIRHGLQQDLELGNLDAQKDWGFAGDYVKGMSLALQHHVAEDYVFATGIPHTVRQFVEQAAHAADLELRWQGSGREEVGMTEGGRVIVRVNPEFYRPLEPGRLYGDASKAATLLNWKPIETFETLVRHMVEADMVNLERADPS